MIHLNDTLEAIKLNDTSRSEGILTLSLISLPPEIVSHLAFMFDDAN